MASWLRKTLAFFTFLLACCHRQENPPIASGQPGQQTGIVTNSRVKDDAPDFEEWRTAVRKKPESLADWQKRVDLVNEIGERRDVRAIPVLLEELLNVSPLRLDDVGDLEGRYVCSKALMKIGEPAVPHVKAQFVIAKSVKEQMVLLIVLQRIKGTRFTVEWLEELQMDKLVPERRQRLAELTKWAASLYE